MNAVAFDTLKFARRLEQAGFSRDQADGAAEALADTFSEQIATRGDIDDLRNEMNALRTEMKAEFASHRIETKTESAALRAELKTEAAALRAEMKTEAGALRAEVKTDIAALRTAVAQWVIGAVFLNGAMILGCVAAVWPLARR